MFLVSCVRIPQNILLRQGKKSIRYANAINIRKIFNVFISTWNLSSHFETITLNRQRHFYSFHTVSDGADGIYLKHCYDFIRLFFLPENLLCYKKCVLLCRPKQLLNWQKSSKCSMPRLLTVLCPIMQYDLMCTCVCVYLIRGDAVNDIEN